MPIPPKTARLNFRVADRDNDLFRRAASVTQESVSDFMLESGRERAERVLADRTEFTLDAESWDSFTAALDRPAQVRPELVELWARPRPD